MKALKVLCEDSRGEFAKCRHSYEKADPARFPQVALLQGGERVLSSFDGCRGNSTPWYEAYFQAYSQCKAWEGKVAADLTACDYSCTSQACFKSVEAPLMLAGEGHGRELHKSGSGLRASRLRASELLGFRLEVLRGCEGGEGYKAFLDRMILDIKGQIAHLEDVRSGPGRVNLTHRCLDIMGTAERCFKSCDGDIEEIIPKSESDIPGCCAPRTQAEDAKCHELENSRKSWEATL